LVAFALIEDEDGDTDIVGVDSSWGGLRLTGTDRTSDHTYVHADDLEDAIEYQHMVWREKPWRRNRTAA
jgi:hypothetical protein